MAIIFQGQLNFGDKCLDHQGNQWAVPILAIPNGSPTQSWALYDAADNSMLVPTSFPWGLALQTSTLTMPPNSAWQDLSAPNHWMLRPDGQLQAEGGPNVLLPTPDMTSVMLGPPPTPPAWSFSPPATESPPATDDYAPAGWTKLWGDEFDEAALDTTKWWQTGSYGGGTQISSSPDEVGHYTAGAANHVMTGSTMQLTALSPTNGVYPTGMIRSKITVPWGGGDGFYMVIRAKVPNGLGTHVAFWTANDDRGSVPSWPPEIGPMECLTNATQNTNQIGLDIHTNNSAAYNATVVSDSSANWDAQYNFLWSSFDAAADFHVYGLEMKAGNWKMTVDGAPIVHGTYNWVYSDGTNAAAGTLIANFDMGGNVAGTGGITTTFPQVYEVDYIRLYSDNPNAQLGVSTIGTV